MTPRLFLPNLAAAVTIAAALAFGVHAQAPERQMAELVSPPASKNPFTGNAAAIEEGRNTYNGVCTACHGVNGGGGEFAPGLAVPGRAYSNRTDVQIFGVIKNGIPGTAMPAHAQRLTDDQIWKITAYIYGLRGTAIDAPTPGDVAHGEQVFFGKGECSSCHMVGGKGQITGPDLSNVASIRKTSSIIDALTKTNNKVYPPGGYQSYQLTPLQTYPAVTIVTNDNKTIEGVVRNEDSYSLQVLGLDQRLYLLDRSKLRSVVYKEKRLMPSDYDKRLSEGEFNDLVAYLTRLNGTPQASAGRSH